MRCFADRISVYSSVPATPGAEVANTLDNAIAVP